MIRITIQRKITYLLYLLILLVCSSTTKASMIKNGDASYPIRVIILDAKTQSPLPYAHIVVEGPKRRVYQTDNNGAVTISLEKKLVKATISFVGYKSKEITLKTGTKRMVVLLDPSAISLNLLKIESPTIQKSSTRTINELSQQALSVGQSETMAHLLSELPGIRTMTTGALIEKPIIEGMSGSRIAIIENGAKLIGQHWGDDHAPELSIHSYAKTQVIRGAESVRYGSNAIGGIVLIHTDVDPTEKGSSLTMGSSYSTNGRMYGGDLSWISTPIQDTNFRYRISGKYYRSGDYSTAEYLLYNTGSKLYDLKSDIAYKYQRLSIQGHFSHYNAEIGIFTGSHIGNLDDLLQRFKKGRPDDSFTAPFSYKISSPKQHIIHTTSNITTRWRLSDQTILIGKYTLQQDYRREYDIRRGDYMNTPSFAFKLTSHQIELLAHHEIKNQTLLQTGTALCYTNNISDTNTKAVPIIPNYNSIELGLYTIYSKRLSDKSFVEGGGRIDYRYSNSKGFDWLGKPYGGQRNFISISGSIGMKHFFSNKTQVYSNIGLAWRPPEMNELYAKGVHHGEAIYQNGNADLPSEKALKWSSGLTTNMKWINLNAHLYLHYINHFIYDIPAFISDKNGQKIPDTFPTLSGVFPIYNFTSSNGLFGGGDLALSFQLPWNLQYRLRGEWIRSRNLTTGGYFPHIPADRYSQQLSYQSDQNLKWAVRGYIEQIYVTKQNAFDPKIDLLPNSPDAYQVINGELSFRYKKESGQNITLYIRGSNILNTLYKEYTNRFRFFAHDKGRDITIGIRLSMDTVHR